MTVDFHVHSTASDGTFSPTELIEKAKDFTAIALTDHDNTAGVARFLAACVRGDHGARGLEQLGLELLQRGADPFAASAEGDPPLSLVVRLGWILFCAAGGSGFLAYVVAAVLIPRKPEE